MQQTLNSKGMPHAIKSFTYIATESLQKYSNYKSFVLLE